LFKSDGYLKDSFQKLVYNKRLNKMTVSLKIAYHFTLFKKKQHNNLKVEFMMFSRAF